MEWSYCIEKIDFSDPIDKDKIEDQLNELGGGGWEPVAAWPNTKPDPLDGVYIIFKKPKSK